MTMKVTIKNEHTDPNVALVVQRQETTMGTFGPGQSLETYTWIGAPLTLTEVEAKPTGLEDGGK